MLILRRAVRFTINPSAPGPDPAFSGASGYSGIPAMRGLGRYYELNVCCTGEPDPATGYLINIKDIDAAVRSEVLPRIELACRERPGIEPGALLPSLLPPLDAALTGAGPARPRLLALRWRLTPYYCVEMAREDLNTVLLRQKFDFAASHRLHIPSLSDEENRALFGKCNNPGGHGHNYQFEPCLAIPLDAGDPPRPAFSLEQLEALADETLIGPFDHKHLNLDTPHFNIERGGVNPTVENIAKVFFDLLSGALAASGARAQLRSITVWETDRTSATFPGE